MKRPDAGTLFNLSDDLPSPPEAPLRYAAEFLGVELPEPRTPEESGLGPMGLRFFSESKRVRNDRIKDGLGYTLRYPTYREGLRAIAEG